MKQKKTTDFTVQEVVTVDAHFSLQSFEKTIATLKSGDRSPAILLGLETVYVRRDDDGFEIEMPGNRVEHCQDTTEVGNYIESRKFFHDIGCGFMIDRMPQVLDMIRTKNPTVAPFDMKR